MINLKIKEPKWISHDFSRFRLHFIQDFQSFTLGTKLRKAEGIFQFLLQNNYNAIQLVGDPNSNFISAFTYYFTIKKIPVYAVHISRSGYRSGNRIISERFSTKFIKPTIVSGEMYDRVYPDFENRSDLKIFPIPNWGISKFSELALHNLWKNIQNKYLINILYIDIGSGLSYLSALHYFKNSDIKIIGISIGLKKERMVEYLNGVEDRIFQTTSEYEIINPTDGLKFGKTNAYLSQFIREMSKKKIYLEGIYSAKSVNTIIELEKNRTNREEIGYLHQGGLISGITRVV